MCYLDLIKEGLLGATIKKPMIDEEEDSMSSFIVDKKVNLLTKYLNCLKFRHKISITCGRKENKFGDRQNLECFIYQIKCFINHTHKFL